MKTDMQIPTFENSFYHKTYWLNQLAGELPETNIITDYIRPEVYIGKNQSVSFKLPDYLSQVIIRFSKRSDFSIYLLLLSAFGVLLKKYTGNRDLIVGIPVYQAITDRESLTNQILPLRLNGSDQLTFKDILLHVKDTTIDAYNHQYYSCELFNLLKLPHAQNRCSIYDIVVLLENIHSQPYPDPNNDLTVSFLVDENTIKGEIKYNESLFREETIKILAKHYINVVKWVLENLNVEVSNIDLLKEPDKYQLLEIFNKNVKAYPVERTIQDLFEEQVECTPDNIAAVYQADKLTYQELNQTVNKLAGLLSSLGVGKGAFVGILQERNLDFLRSILAVLKAGGAYVPIDSTYPPERIKYMLFDSEVKILLTDSSNFSILTANAEQLHHLKCVICLDIDANNSETINPVDISVYTQSDFNQFSDQNLEKIGSGNDRAYMLYTSGSTGQPKGAIIRHNGAINHIYAQFDALELQEGFSFLQSAPASSDISVWQFLAPLLIGGKTIIIDTETVCEPEKLFQVIQTEKLTLIELVPVVLKRLIDHVSQLSPQQRSLPDLKLVMVTGEYVSVELVNDWLSVYPSIKVVNAYGPTEAADDITQLIIEQPLPKNQRSVPIGKPLANLNLYVLDPQMQLVPIGVPGEICVSGIGVGEGYWQNEEKTNLNFVPNRFTHSNQLSSVNRDVIYKTGDLGRWLPDGTIEFLGRIDHQVKIRGFRIELGEIEAVLNHHVSVREAVVVAREEQTGDRRLVAYIVSDPEISITPSDLREFLQQKLPDYMIPSTFVQLDALPLTPNGKVDRNALPAPLEQLISPDSDTPATPVEEMLAGIWTKVLSRACVSIHDNFFELGGHSLLATLVISQVRQVFQVELPLRRLFECPTVAQLAQAVEVATKTGLGLDAPPIERCSHTEAVPLSFAQQRMWFLAQLEPDNPFYNLPTAVRLQGALNSSALEQTFNEILHRHQALRTRVESVNGQAIAVITPAAAFQMPLVDLSALPLSQRDTEVQKLISAEAQHPFDLQRDLLLRVKLLRLEEQDHILLLTLHHIAADGWSIGVLIDEVATLYSAFAQGLPSPLPELPIQYGDFAAWQRQWLQGEVLDTQMRYWHQQLADAPVLLLPTDRPRPAVQSYRGDYYDFALNPALSHSLLQLSQQAGCTLFMTLLAGFTVLLGRYSNSDDIVVGTPIANRNRAEVEGLIGLFINTLVLRTDLSDNPTLLALLERVREVALGAYAHQDLPFEQLVEALQPQRSLSHSPLFQVMFVLQNEPQPEAALPGLRVSAIDSDSGATQFDLTLSLAETAAGLVGNIEYNTDLFEQTTIARMAGHYQTILEGMVADPQQRLSKLPWLSQTEQQQFLVWNHTEAEYPQDQCIHDLFEAQVQRSPDAVAVVFEGQQLTYQELNTRANQLAHHLHQLGVKPEVLVGICMERSLEMVIGILGILKAGGAYVPLDPNYPKQRLAFMLLDAQVSLLVTQQPLLNQLPDHQAQVICLDSDWAAISQECQENPVAQTQPENLAYVIYTSGSTGIPKGVMVQHRCLVNYTQAIASAYELTPSDRILQFASLNFDVAAEEIFPTLGQGATLVLRTDEMLNSIPEFLQHAQTLELTVINLPTAFWHQLTTQLSSTGLVLPDSLRLVIIGGERALSERLSIWQQVAGQVRLLNCYGPTETTIGATVCDLSESAIAISAEVPIGKPLPNVQTYVLDTDLQPLPIGVPGELYIGGVGVARGYLNRPELTDEKFIPNPYSKEPRARLYKTGDWVRYRADGNLEYLGRIDHQVKLRGFRIEPGEIEAALSQHPAVQETVVDIQETVPGDKRLIAYVVAAQPLAASLSDLRQFLQDKLPAYMIPAVFVPLDALPLTPNAKVDRKSLPTPEIGQAPATDGSPGTNPIEEMLVSIWAKVLGKERIGIDENFFELGGHSLLATQVISQVRQFFQVEMPLRQLFEMPTIAQLAQAVETTTQAGLGLVAPPIKRRLNSAAIPLSFAQQRMWFLAQLEPDTPFYNLSTAVRLEGALNCSALEQSFSEILRRHEALHTCIDNVAGQAVAVITPVTSLPLPLLDLSGLSPTQKDAEVQQLISTEAQQPFDLQHDLLLRLKLLRLGQDHHIVLLTMHHVAADGWSIGVLIDEVATLYSAFAQGLPSPLPELPIQYGDFAAWQRQWLQGEVLDTQMRYWHQQLADAPVLLLPTDRPRPAVQSYRGDYYDFALNPALSHSLLQLSQQAGCTLFMTLLAGFTVLLGRYSNSDDIVVGTPIANRNQIETERLIGLFVNTLVLRTRLSGNPTVMALLDQVREVALGAYVHQDLPFEQLVEALQPQRSLSHTPLFQVMFVLQNAPTSMAELPGLRVSSLESDSGTAQFDLTLSMAETAAGLVGNIEYNTDLFDQMTIARMAGHYQTILESMVADPQQRVSELSLLTTAEQQQLVAWNRTEAEYPQDQCIHDLFEAQVQRSPDAVAVVFEGQQLTYQELNTRANQLAHHLHQLGVKPEVLVGICMERSLEMVIAILGILKAGGAYVPLDPDYPQERLDFMVADARVSVLLSQQSLLSQLPQHQAQVVCLDTDWDTIAQQAQHNPLNQTHPEHLIYLIYTSGSTGKPKGVMNIHQALVNRLHWMQQTYSLTSDDRVLQKTPFSFDVSVWEFFWPLLTGARLVIAKPQGHRDSAYLVELIAQQQISTVHFVPSMLQVFLQEWGLERCQRLKHVFCSGESLSRELQDQFFARLSCSLHNLYGPTEAAIDVTFWQCQPENPLRTVPIGRPISNTKIYLLGDRGDSVPIGVAGELHIGGVGLARGYFNRPELTAKKFIVHPQLGRLYKTGDLVRYREDGNIEYLGRMDYQVKLRGFRIEPGEIEAALNQHPQVRAAVVVVREIQPSGKRLVAYIVSHPEASLVPIELREFLQSQLPDYMIPSAFVQLDALPLTPNGKVDRRALPEPDIARPELDQAFVAPHTFVETKLVEIWAQVLGVEQVGIHDNFFELGGDSILSIQVVARANQAGLQLTPKLLFEHQTIATLAAVATTKSMTPAEQGLVTGSVLLTPIQQWFFQQNLPNPHHFNQAVLLQVHQQIDSERLEQALWQLLHHHDALRLRFEPNQSGWQQIHTSPDSGVPLLRRDFSALTAAEQLLALETAANELQAGLNLATGPIMRVGFFDLGVHQPSRLMIVIHHLVVDGVSWRILLEDLQTAYQQLSLGQQVQLPAKTTSFKQWSQTLREYAHSALLQPELDYWLELSQQCFSPLPVDFPTGENTVASTCSILSTLSIQDTQALLQEVPKVYHTEINDVLLTALVQALAHWTGTPTLLVDLEGHGREEIAADVDVSRTVGWFTTVFPVRLNLGAATNPGEALKVVKEQLRGIPNRGIGYGVLRYLSADQKRQKLSELPPAEVLFNYLGQFDQSLSQSSWLSMAPDSSGSPQSPQGKRSHLLEISSWVSQGQLQLDWSYSQQVHRQTTVEALAQGFIEVLRSLIIHCQSADVGGFTPSDFAEFEHSQWTQADIDAIAAAIEEI